MSGIAGWADYSKRLHGEGRTVKSMTKRLAAGTDAEEGFWVSEHMLLGAAGPNAQGPVVCKRAEHMYILVFDGELYNTADIIIELERLGHKFETRDDAHAILHAYMEWGDEFLTHLNGVFALAIRDAERERLFLARDRFGIKPLFCCRLDNGVIFASTLRALLAHQDITPRLGERGLNEIFTVGPARTPDSGVFDGIAQLLPGVAA